MELLLQVLRGNLRVREGSGPTATPEGRRATEAAGVCPPSPSPLLSREAGSAPPCVPLFGPFAPAQRHLVYFLEELCSHSQARLGPGMKTSGLMGYWREMVAKTPTL